VKALNSITSKDIGSLKALKNPPDIVKRIFDAVLLLRFYPLEKPQWQEVKGAMVRCTWLSLQWHALAVDRLSTDATKQRGSATAYQRSQSCLHDLALGTG
jgi:hypothetical protein